MKKNILSMNWLIPMLGVILIGGGYPLAKSYIGYEAEIRSQEQSAEIVDRLLETCQLNETLMQFHNVECAAPARGVQALLSANIEAINADLASVDPGIRTIAAACFERVGYLRSATSPLAAGLLADRSDGQIAAPTTLAHAQTR
jgi:hypothetical protein